MILKIIFPIIGRVWLLVACSGDENVVLLSMTDFTQKQKEKHCFFPTIFTKIQ